MECLAYGTEKCATCSQQEYCKKLHEKLENGTYNALDDYWDYINSAISDDELEDLLDF